MAPKKKTEVEEAVVATETAVAEEFTETTVAMGDTEAKAEVRTYEAEDEEQARRKQFAYMRELVPVTPAPPRSGEDPNYPIGINGKMWILPKGKTSQVPRYVAMAFNQAEAAKGTQLDSQAELLKRQSGNTVDLGQLTEDQIVQLKKMLGL